MTGEPDKSIEGIWVIREPSGGRTLSVFVPVKKSKLSEMGEIHGDFDIRVKIKIVEGKGRLCFFRDTPVGSLTITTVSLDNRLGSGRLLGDHLLQGGGGPVMVVFYDEVLPVPEREAQKDSKALYSLCARGLVLSYLPTEEDLAVCRYWREHLA